MISKITKSKTSPEKLELILKTNFMEALKDSSLRSFSFSTNAQTVLIHEQGMPAAILIFREVELKKLAEIDFIATSKAHQRKGLASRLINGLSAEYDEIWLELSSKNSKALSFYLKHGFLVQGERADYYAKGIHALNMVKTRAS